MLAWPHPVLEPVGTRVELSCRVHPEYGKGWWYSSWNSPELPLAFGGLSWIGPKVFRDLLNIEAEMYNDGQSLFLTGHKQHTPFFLQCIGVHNYVVQVCESPRALIRFYGKREMNPQD